MKTSSGKDNYIKILNEQENHHNFQYQEGLNICPDFEKGVECANGFHFTDTQNFSRWLEYGSHYRKVTYIRDMETGTCKTKYKCSSFVLGPRKEVSELLVTEEQQLDAVTQNGRSIQYIKNPSEEMKLVAVTINGNAIQFIVFPSEKVQLAAVSQNGYSIQFIKYPSISVQLAAVTQYGLSIKIIKDPSILVQLAAVNQNGLAIQYIKDPSEKVQLAAITQNEEAINYIEYKKGRSIIQKIWSFFF